MQIAWRGSKVLHATKLKINTQSSTQTEFVGVDEPLTLMMWSRLLATAQGMEITDNILYQDNISVIRLKKNGKVSYTKRTKHIEIRYNFSTLNAINLFLG